MSEIEKQEAKGRKRNVQINIRISEAEAEQLRKKVEQSGMSQQEYILSCVLNIIRYYDFQVLNRMHYRPH